MYTMGRQLMNTSVESIDYNLYKGFLVHLPSIIALFERMTHFLTNLAASSADEGSFPEDLMDEFEEEMSESPNSSCLHLPHSFIHSMKKYITQIIALENSMINVLEDIITFSETRWNYSPYHNNSVEFSDSNSQISIDDESSHEFRKQREKFIQLLRDFESCTNANDVYERGTKIHKYLQLNKHLDAVNKFYKIVQSLKHSNDSFVRHNGFELTKNQSTLLLEDGEKLEAFFRRAVDKVELYQRVIYQVNTTLDLVD